MGYSEHDVERLVERELDDYLDTGRIVRSVPAWRKNCRERLLENERHRPGFIQRSVNGMDAAAQGRRVTCCREVRGTHAISYIYDAEGSDQPPSWWSLGVAKAYEETRAATRAV